jgi:DNA polymerase-3 subunit beta
MTTATKSRAITLNAAELRAALSDVIKAVPTRSPKPVLANVRLGDGLLTGTDLDVRIDREIDYHGDPILLPAAKLNEILRASAGGVVTIKPAGATVTVKCGGGSWTLPTEDAAEFPAWEPAGLKPICSLPADQFARMAKATTYACDADSSRYALGGVQLEVTPTEDGARQDWVSTDGRRLAHVTTESQQALDGSITLITSETISRVAGMAKGNGSVHINSNGSEVQFELDGVTVTSRVLNGKFPTTWKDTVGQLDGEPSVLNVSEMLAAVESAAIVTSEQSKGISVTWTADTLVLSGRSSEYGESTVKCGLVAAGTTSNTKLDPRYLADFLRHLSPEEEPQVDVYATDSQSRVLLKCGPYTGVIMPLAAE